MDSSIGEQSSKSFDHPILTMFLPLICFWLVSNPHPLSQCFHLSPYFQLVCVLRLLQSSNIFNHSMNPTLTMPLCHVFDSSMFPRSCNSSNGGPKLPLDGTWPKSTKLNVNLVGTTKSPKLQNVSSCFAIPKVLHKIHDFTVVNFDEIMELSNSQSYPQVDPPRKNQKFGVDGIGKKPRKKSYDSSRKFQAERATKLPWVEGLMATGWIIQRMKCKVCSLI